MSEVINYTNPWDLTAAEMRVMQALMVSGNTRQVAQELGIKLSTVRSHLYAAHTKLGVRNTLLLALKFDRWNRE